MSSAPDPPLCSIALPGAPPSDHHLLSAPVLHLDPTRPTPPPRKVDRCTTFGDNPFPSGIGTHLQRVLRRALDLWRYLELTDLARQRIQHGAPVRIGLPQQRHSVEVQKIEGQEHRLPPTSLEKTEIGDPPASLYATTSPSRTTS